MSFSVDQIRASPAHPPTAPAHERLLCRACKYEFTGVENVSTCPECGKPGTGAPLAAALLPSTDKPVCIRCGYDLAGLPAEARCSECGTLVGRSLHGNLLRYAAPEYLRTLNRGGLMVYLGIIGLCCAVIAAYPLFLFEDQFENLIWIVFRSFPEDVLATAVCSALAVVSILMLFAGWTLLAAPDPAFVGRDPAAASRRTMRICAVGCLLAGAGLLLSYIVSLASRGVPIALGIAQGTLALTMVVAALTQFLASAWYLAYLAGRIPDIALVTRLRTMRIILFIALGAFGLMVVGALGGAGAGLILMPVWLVLMGIVLVRYAGAIEKLRAVFREYAAAAKPNEAA